MPIDRARARANENEQRRRATVYVSAFMLFRSLARVLFRGEIAAVSEGSAR